MRGSGVIRQSGDVHSPARPDVLRYAAFADDSSADVPSDAPGGNPAGIVLDAAALDDPAMLAIAAEVGYAETAFLVEGRAEDRRFGLRYFSPVAEVPFCGHATIATAVVLAERIGVGPLLFDTAVGEVAIETTSDGSGAVLATFTSVEPELRDFEPSVLARLLGLLGLSSGDLDPAFPVSVAYAGNWHPIVVLRDRSAFDGFTFDPVDMRRLMDEQGWRGTVTILHRRTPDRFEARNLFPVGTITEDPATGSAAAAFGGYLRESELIDAPARIEVLQGRHVGRPSRLVVDIPASGGVSVSGGATPIGV